MAKIVPVDPFRCRVWDLHDRMDAHIDEANCKGEIESIAKYGQLVPVLGRPLKNHPDYSIELIYGARRLFVARHLRKSLLVEVREISDTEGIIAMDVENRHRLDISPYERGVSYLRWLRGGHFKSQEDLARALQVSPSQVSRLLKVAQLPAVVLSAFRSPVDICEAWALDLASALEDPDRRASTCAKARAMMALPSRPPAREIFRQLVLAALAKKKARVKTRDEVVVGHDGKPLFRVRKRLNSVAILLPAAVITARRLEDICLLLSAALQEPSDAKPSKIHTHCPPSLSPRMERDHG